MQIIKKFKIESAKKNLIPLVLFVFTILIVFSFLSAKPAKAAISKGPAFTGSTEGGTSFTVTGVNASSNALVLVGVTMDSDSPATVVNSISGGSLTWVQVNGGSVENSGSHTTEIWRAYATSSLSSQTITINISLSVSAVGVVISYTGTKASSGDPDAGIGTVATSSGRSTSYSISVSETGVGRMAGMAGYETEASGHTPGSGYTEDAQIHTADWARGAWQTNDTAHNGTDSTTFNGTFSGTTEFAVIAIEILESTTLTQNDYRFYENVDGLIPATTSIDVDADNRDAMWTGGSRPSTDERLDWASDGILYISNDGDNQDVAFAFQINGPNSGDIINSATLQANMNGQSSNTNEDVLVYGSATDSVTVFNASDVHSVTTHFGATTSANVTWTLTAGTGSKTSPNLTAILQEIIDRPGWASGNYVAFAITGSPIASNVWKSFESNSHAGTDPATLTFSYSKPLAATNTAPLLASTSSPIRLRMNVTASSVDLATSSQVFKLQFSQATSSGWADVGATSSTTSAWRFYDNSSVADDATLSSVVLSNSEVAQSYEEANPTKSNPRAISAGEEGEWDFALDPANATVTTYYFRMIKSDDTALDSYVNYPSIIIGTGNPNLTQIHYRWRNDDGSESGATFATTTDTVLSGWSEKTLIRLRIEISNEGTGDATDTQYALQYGEKSGSCGDIGSWTTLVNTGFALNQHWSLVNTSNIADGDSTTNVSAGGGLADENTTFVAGEFRSLNNLTNIISATTTEFTELEYSLWAETIAIDEGSYCFRLTNNGSTTNFTYTVYPEVTLAAAKTKSGVTPAGSPPSTTPTTGGTAQGGVTATGEGAGSGTSTGGGAQQGGSGGAP